jgi:hypothetical protein
MWTEYRTLQIVTNYHLAGYGITTNYDEDKDDSEKLSCRVYTHLACDVSGRDILTELLRRSSGRTGP